MKASFKCAATRAKSVGFTLIELVVALVIVAILAAFALPKFAELQTPATVSVLEGLKAQIESASNFTHSEVLLHPENKSNNNSRYNFDNGDQIRLRADYPDGRWNNTFAFLLNTSGMDISQVNTNNCNNNDWCVRQRGRGWFASRGYTTAPSGRGFVVYPRGYNLNSDRCYAYFFTPNGSANPASPMKPYTRVDVAEC